ncbi:chloride channel protein [Vagococcus xieshaowenii]|uniref:Voltage-gated chloride channel protein n=1 Tax=Vagococcus xieshaowenii TaxID=2562451 RepID=A0AAJ5EDU2_9ENTE|nr:chloride channel protein [Vagococcus xieshaowenii]QCA28755.1 voltage-gated chloride channel protein [Vagococcus xieshaowenii]TFZ40438.1 voltage-gated chloride channel protein [Vagococcus xieshaowenii]
MNKKIDLRIPIYSALIGLIVGLLDYVFGSVLLKIGDIRTDYFSNVIPWLPVVGLMIVYCYQRYGNEVSKGMGLLFDVHQDKKENIPLILIPLIVVSTWLTHLFGGSAGREGVAVQIGGTVGNKLFRRFPQAEQTANYKQLFLIIGMAAGFGGLFQTPLTATMFAFEVFRTKKIKLINIIYVLIAAFISFFTTSFLGLEKFAVRLSNSQNWWTTMTFVSVFKWLLLILSLFAIGKLFALLLTATKRLLNDRFQNPYLKMTVMGTFLALLLFFGHYGRYSGLGTNLIDSSFFGVVAPYDWLLKLLFTILTLSIGFQGGEVTPLFSIGASFGYLFATVFDLPLMPVVALGYIGVFSSASHTFLTAILLAYEVFGWQMVPLAMVQAVIFYLLKQNISIYPINSRSVK